MEKRSRPYTEEKKEEERIVIRHLKLYDKLEGCNGNEHWYQFSSSHPLEEKSNSAIIKAIEFIVNGGDGPVHWTSYNQSQQSAEDIKIKDAVNLIQDKGYCILDPIAFLDYKRSLNFIKEHKYTEDDMRKCFHRKRRLEITPGYGSDGLATDFLYEQSLEDYINSLNK